MKVGVVYRDVLWVVIRVVVVVGVKIVVVYVVGGLYGVGR